MASDSYWLHQVDFWRLFTVEFILQHVFWKIDRWVFMPEKFCRVVIPSFSELCFPGNCTLTPSCDSEWVWLFLCWTVIVTVPLSYHSPQSTSVPKYHLPELIPWKSLVPGNLKKLPHQRVWMYLSRVWSGTSIARKPEAVPDGFANTPLFKWSVTHRLWTESVRR
jgi:hypothetical protein